MAEQDIKIKDAPLVDSVDESMKIPVSDGSNQPKTISVGQIKTASQPDYSLWEYVIKECFENAYNKYDNSIYNGTLTQEQYDKLYSYVNDPDSLCNVPFYDNEDYRIIYVSLFKYDSTVSIEGKSDRGGIGNAISKYMVYIKFNSDLSYTAQYVNIAINNTDDGFELYSYKDGEKTLALSLSGDGTKFLNDKGVYSQINEVKWSRLIITRFGTLLTDYGIYIVDMNGKFYTESDWDTANNDSAVGVAVIDKNWGFIIGKTQSNSGIAWSGQLYGTTVSGILTTTSSSTAKTDYAGEANSSIVRDLTNGEINAFNWAYGNTITVNGTTLYGYIGALGEWQTAYNNKSAIDSALSTIGGTAINNSYYHYSSTQSSSDFAWRHNWNSGNVDNFGYKDRSYGVRAFFPIF